jgi:hypothetical protein
MKDVFELLREADGVKDDFEHLYQARESDAADGCGHGFHGSNRGRP